MKELQELARELLAGGEVRLVVGWEDGRRGARPAFVRDPDDAGRLIFDNRCVHNLATYLDPRRDHLAGPGRIALVVKGCDTLAVAGLLREHQVTREDLVLIGVRCGGVLETPDLPAPQPLTPETVAPRCHDCPVREPRLFDHVVGEPLPAPPQPAVTLDQRVAELEALPLEERWAFWRDQFAKCVRCHACRQVCPLCICERCVAEKTRPQWIDPAPHPRGTVNWNLTRALHLAGRCVGCGECERFCPVGIPLSLLNRKLQLVVKERFDHVPSDDPAQPAPIGEYRLDDREEFIR